MDYGYVAGHSGLMWPVGIPTIFPWSKTVPCPVLTAGNLPAVRAAQGDCERV